MLPIPQGDGPEPRARRCQRRTCAAGEVGVFRAWEDDAIRATRILTLHRYAPMSLLLRTSLSAFGFTLMTSLSALAQAPLQAPKPDETQYYHQVSHLAGLATVVNPRFSPSAKFVAFAATAAGQGGYHIFVMPMAGGAPVQVTTGDHDDQQPAWFPTGDRLRSIRTA